MKLIHLKCFALYIMTILNQTKCHLNPRRINKCHQEIRIDLKRTKYGLFGCRLGDLKDRTGSAMYMYSKG